MEVKTLKKQLGAAIAMVLVAAVALGSATFAWFVSNNTVKATTANISAQSNAPYLKIDTSTNGITSDSKTSITFNEPTSNAALYPAQVVNGTSGKAEAAGTSPVFQSAYASAAGAATILDKSRYNVGDLEAAVNSSFAIKESFKIGTSDEKAGSFNDLKVAKVELSGSTSTTGLDSAISVLLVCGNYWGVYKVSNDGALVGAYCDNTTVSGNFAADKSGILAEKIEAGSSNAVSVDAYVFYDGSDDKVYTENLKNLSDLGLTITFTATPVNTQGVEVKTSNAV